MASVALTRAPKKLSIWQKLGYGLGDLGFSLTSTSLGFFYLFFLTDIVRLDPALAGTTLLVGRLWDAVNDPLVGTLSDRTRSRWGRRRPYLLFGALPFSLAFMALWFIPPWQSQVGLAIYFTLVFIAFDLLYTLVQVPYSALTPELTDEYDERTSLHSYRMFFSILFGLVGAVAPPALVEVLAGGAGASLAAKQQAYLVTGIALGLLSGVPLLVTFKATFENPERQLEEPHSLQESLRIARGNRAFLVAAGLFLLTWVPVDLIQAVLVYLVKYYLGMEESLDLIFGLIFGTAILFLPFWVWVTRRWSKEAGYRTGLSFLAVVLILLILVPPGQPAWVYGLSVLAGIGISAAHVIPLSMLPDVMEWDELRTGRRQEGAYYGVISLINKLIDAIDLWWVGLILSWVGYRPNAAQNVPVLWTIRIISGPIPALLLTTGIVLSFAYPLTRERHQRIVRALERKKAIRARRAPVKEH